MGICFNVKVPGDEGPWVSIPVWELETKGRD